MLYVLMPVEPEVQGLLALLVITQARGATRADADGHPVLLEDQDRSQWDRGGIAEGHDLVMAAFDGGPRGRFALQAAIAALHAEAPTYADTDWPKILALYDALLARWPSPVVALNRAIVVAMIDGPDAALDEIARLEEGGRLVRYHYLPAVKADLLRRLGRYDEAAQAYRAAVTLTGNAAERAFLTEQLEALG
jgi:RNA polymerase sigma-70 factor (ECF subfamily)